MPLRRKANSSGPCAEHQAYLTAVGTSSTASPGRAKPPSVSLRAACCQLTVSLGNCQQARPFRLRSERLGCPVSSSLPNPVVEHHEGRRLNVPAPRMKPCASSSAAAPPEASFSSKTCQYGRCRFKPPLTPHSDRAFVNPNDSPDSSTVPNGASNVKSGDNTLPDSATTRLHERAAIRRAEAGLPPTPQGAKSQVTMSGLLNIINGVAAQVSIIHESTEHEWRVR